MTIGLKFLISLASSKQRAAQNDGGHPEANYQAGHIDQRGQERRRRGRRVEAEPPKDQRRYRAGQ
jgi:hypothetical protein